MHNVSTSKKQNIYIVFYIQTAQILQFFLYSVHMSIVNIASLQNFIKIYFLQYHNKSSTLACTTCIINFPFCFNC